MSLAALPIFVRLAGRPVVLVGSGDAAAAKRRLLERAGARVVDADAACAGPACVDAALAIVACDDPEPVVQRLRARGLLVNTVDRPDLCDFTLPAIVDRDPVIVAIGTGGVSAGLAAALRQRLEALLPVGLGGLARALGAARAAMRMRWPDPVARRAALADALAGPLDPLGAGDAAAVARWLEGDAAAGPAGLVRIRLADGDPDSLTLRQARALAQAERVYHRPDVPPALLARARADAARIVCAAPPAEAGPGLSVDLEVEGE